MNDETLILYYYKDGLSEAEARDVQQALAADAALRARYEALCADLETAAEPAPAARRGDLEARLHDSLDRAVRREHHRVTPERGGARLPLFPFGALIAAALVAGIGIGAWFSTGREQPAVPDAGIVANTDAGSPAPAAAFERGLQVHLMDSRRELAGLAADTDAERAKLFLRMVQQNRLFESAAEQHDAKDLARVLRAFEPILMRLAADDISAAEARALQAQLSFELNAMLTKLGREVSEDTGPI